MNFSGDLVKGTFVPVILSLLKDRPMYGYEMVKLVNARTGGRLEWREGTLYPTLHRLEGEGRIKATWQDVPEAPGRQRKYYHITRKGLAESARRAQEWRDFSTAVSAIVLGG